MKTDLEIHNEVIEELRHELFLSLPDIGVSVHNGIVTLSGHVDGYTKKRAAEKAAKRVQGVRAIAEEITVGISPESEKTDEEIAEAAVFSLQWNEAVKNEQIKIRVENGVVQLEGEVDWDCQRTAACNAVENLVGVKSVINLVTLKPHIYTGDIKSRIEKLYGRQAAMDAGKIDIMVRGNTVILRGSVNSLAEKEAATAAAYATNGVNMVIDELELA